MQLLDRLTKARNTEKDWRVVRRLAMLIIFLSLGTFSATACKYNCDRRTVAKWWRRLNAVRKTPKGIREALSDKPRPGRPPKITKIMLEEARKWCEGRAFETVDLSNTLFDLSGVRLSNSQVGRYMRKWGHSKKKTQPVEINRASMGAVRVWRHRLFKIVQKFERLGYTIVTMDEAHFTDSKMSFRFWSKIGMRIFMIWTGNHHRFSMMCSMTSNGRAFFNHCSTANTETFLEHIERVYQKVGKMVLVLDRASYHKSADAMAYFKTRDIILVWYPVGHPYLNPVEEVWGVLKAAVDDSIRYADLKTHLAAVYKFIDNEHHFDFDFATFWRRKPTKGIMRPIIRIEGEPNTSITERQILTQKEEEKEKRRQEREKKKKEKEEKLLGTIPL